MGNEQGIQGIQGTRGFWELGTRSDEQILGGVRDLLGTERHVTARLLAHLNEVSERRLHLKHAHSSMFEYCLELGMSEDEAGRRLCAAGVAKHFPAVYALVDSGKLSLSVVCKLKHYLSEENQAELLAGVSGLSFRKAEVWLAARFARSDVPSTLRKLPTKPLYPRRSDRGITEPLSSERYRVQFTASESLKEKLELARDLMAHRNPTGDFAPIVEKALDLLIDELKRQRFGQTKRPARKPPATNRPATNRPATNPPAQPPRAKPERITNATRREVIERDGLRCSFVDEHGRRCKARAYLELEHRKPWGKGGSSDAENIRCFCRAHNKLLAELEYGRGHIERAIAKRRAALSAARIGEGALAPRLRGALKVPDP